MKNILIIGCGLLGSSLLRRISKKKIAKKIYKDEKINIILHYYICHIKNGNIRLNEHENSKWLKKENLDKYDFVNGDKAVLSLL